MISLRPRTASMARRWTGAATACVPRAPGRLAEGTEERRASVARARIASVGDAGAVLPSTPPATMLNSAKRPSLYQHIAKHPVTLSAPCQISCHPTPRHPVVTLSSLCQTPHHPINTFSSPCQHPIITLPYTPSPHQHPFPSYFQFQSSLTLTVLHHSSLHAPQTPTLPSHSCCFRAARQLSTSLTLNYPRL